MSYSRKAEIKCVIWAILLCLMVAKTIFLKIESSNAEISYDVVEVTVIDASKGKIAGTNPKRPNTVNTVTVSYQGKEYELRSVRDVEYNHCVTAKKTKEPIEAYYSGGDMFANIEGVRANTKSSKKYLLFLGLSFIIFFILAITAGQYVDYKKAEDMENNQR